MNSGSFQSLTDVVGYEVFKYLSVRDLCAACLSCSRWREIANSDKLWQIFCKKNGWLKYGYGAMDLVHVTSCDKFLTRTNVSGTSPAFNLGLNSENTLSDLPRWRIVYIQANYLKNNWTKGHYSVLPFLKGHENRVTSLDSNGQLLISGSEDRLIIWDLTVFKMRFEIPNHHIVPNTIKVWRNFFAVSYSDGIIKVYDTKSGATKCTFHGRSSAENLLFIDNDSLVSTYADKCIRVWDIKENRLLYTLIGHSDDIECIAVCGKICVSGDWSGNVIFWDLSSGSLLSHHMGVHSDSVMQCVMDEAIVATGDGDGKVAIWNTTTSESTHILEGSTKDVYCLEMSNTHIAAAGSAGVIAVWSRASNFELLFTLEKHLGVVRSLKFNDDFLISGGDRKMICVWCLKSGKLLNVVHRNPDLLHVMWVNELKIITASPNSPGSITVISYW